MTANLDSIIAHYHSLFDAALARETFTILDTEQRARSMLIGPQRDRLICPVLRPRFITRAQYETLTRAASLVGRAIRAVSAAALTDPTLLAPYRLTPAERELLAIDPGYHGATVFGRLDGFLAPDGAWCWFIEANVESPAGIGYDDALAGIFDQTRIMAAFRETFQATALPVRQELQQMLLDAYRAWGGRGTPTVAIVDFPGVTTWSEFEHLQQRFEADGLPTVVCTPDDLQYQGGRLYVETRLADGGASWRPVDLVYRRLLQHEFLSMYDLHHPLIRAYADRVVCVVNPFRTKPAHTKLIMWLLSDDEGPASGILDADSAMAVARHIPWTRLVQRGTTRYRGERVDLLDFARRHRERLALKPNDAYGGEGVILGWETSPLTWEGALERALDEPSVLQERVPMPEEPYPIWSDNEGIVLSSYYVDADPCLYGDRAMGCLTRIATAAKLNVSAGGGSAPPTFLVEPKLTQEPVNANP
ncbi:hypothetical protein [Roseiflexus castenholzii]|jgi:hypothetical protein|uniref:Circularly permuted ATPgrasp domain-containing protein n=1 Tax=Roseiflexus castenholzii (strain DSM 13941 / HLO8) TaxID=383372 RepID=A7NL65_ROSCS|nr:hypothetical protein [Roseiflexus castenholzii]ABU58238.1 protein of unknown function DUF407 [Roseiflexus castenholzii DSM 13941]